MIDFHAAQVRGHRQNIERYCRLLATELTDLERQYLHKRIAEEVRSVKTTKKARVSRMTSRGLATVPAHSLISAAPPLSSRRHRVASLSCSGHATSSSAMILRT